MSWNPPPSELRDLLRRQWVATGALVALSAAFALGFWLPWVGLGVGAWHYARRRSEGGPEPMEPDERFPRVAMRQLSLGSALVHAALIGGLCLVLGTLEPASWAVPGTPPLVLATAWALVGGLGSLVLTLCGLDAGRF